MSRLRRLAESLGNTEGEVDVELDFGVDARDRPSVTGRVSAELSLICQRCLEPMPFSVRAEVGLVFIPDRTEDEALDEEDEPFILGDAPVAVSELVEDELILALPLIPKHPEGECEGGRIEDCEPEEHGEARSPFAALAALKKGDA